MILLKTLIAIPIYVVLFLSVVITLIVYPFIPKGG